MRMVRVALLGFAFLSLSSTGFAQVRVFRGATVLPVSGAPIVDGVVVVEDGVITAVGPSASVISTLDGLRSR